MFIFNFHHVEPRLKRLERKHITITPDGLLRFIRLLRDIGMQPASLQELLEGNANPSFGSSRFALTFDDAYENFYHHAAPILIRENCPATVFVIAGKIGGTNDWDQAELPMEERDRLMSWEQMKELSRSEQIAFGSHGLQHRNYAALSPAELSREIEESYAILSDSLPHAFLPILAYPWGKYSKAALQVMAQSSYCYGLTTQKGEWTSASDPYAIPRYSVYYRDGNPLVMLGKLLANRILFR